MNIKTLNNLYPSIEVHDEIGGRAILSMAVEDWIRVPRYPYQSPEFTERRTSDAYWKLLNRSARSSKLYLSVVTAATRGQDICKIDGHARTELWKRGYLQSPQRVIVMLFEASDEKELAAFYNTVQRGARQFYEQVRAVYENLGISINSPRLRRGFIVDALNIVARGAPRAKQHKRTYPNEINLAEVVGIFRSEIELLDSINPPFDVFYSGIIAAAILSLALDPKRLDFFAKLATKKGTKVEGRMNPIESVLNLLDDVRRRSSQAQTHIDLCARTIRAVELWELGEKHSRYWLKNTLTPANLMAIVREVRRAKKSRRNYDGG